MSKDLDYNELNQIIRSQLSIPNKTNAFLAFIAKQLIEIKYQLKEKE